MDRLLRLGGGMPGLNQGPPPSDAPVVDTAEQVKSYGNLYYIGIKQVFKLLIMKYFKGLHFLFGAFKNVKTWKSWSTNGSYGSYAW